MCDLYIQLMTYYYMNKHGAKRSADYFMKNMKDAMPSHIHVVYDINDNVVWTK